jgi:signal transduction histidine kinase
VLLAAAAVRSKALAGVSVMVGLNALGAALGIVLGEVALFRWVGDRSALLAVGSVVIALGALLAGRFLFGAVAEHRERTRAHATLGRMSGQMAHDLRNPLTAIRGAAQFLQAELAAGRPLEPQAGFFDLLVEETSRMARVLDQYERLGRVDPARRSIDVNRLVEQAAASVGNVSKRLAADLPACDVDPDLFAIAIDNVLRNAREAVGESGHIEVATTFSGGAVAIEITDDGPGMDARTRERAFDDFFTTKLTGSGLGLPFTRRVMEAHQGSVAVDSNEGRGTRVTLKLSAVR